MISPIENNNMVIRAQDYSTIRQNELAAPNTQHVVIQEQIEHRDDANVHTVRQKDDSDKADTHHDAREEGRNKYFSSGKRKSTKPDDEDGVVIRKDRGGFDISI